MIQNTIGESKKLLKSQVLLSDVGALYSPIPKVSTSLQASSSIEQFANQQAMK